MPDVSNRKRKPNGEFDNEDRQQKPSTSKVGMPDWLNDDDSAGDNLPDRSGLVYSPVPEYVKQYLEAPSKNADNVPPKPFPDEYQLLDAQEATGREYYTNISESTRQMMRSLSSFGEDRPGFVSWVDKDSQQLNIIYNGRRAVIDIQQHGPLAWNVYDKKGQVVDNSDNYPPTSENHPYCQSPDESDNLNDVYASMSGRGRTPTDWYQQPSKERAEMIFLSRNIGSNAKLTTVGNPNYLQYAEGYTAPNYQVKPTKGWNYYSLNKDANGNYTSLSEYDPSNTDSEVFATKENLSDKIQHGTFNDLAAVTKDPIHTTGFDRNVSNKEIANLMPGWSDQIDDLCSSWSNSLVGRNDVQSYCNAYNGVCVEDTVSMRRTQMRFTALDDDNVRVDYRSQKFDQDTSVWVENPAASGSFTTGGDPVETDKLMRRATSFHKYGNNLDNYQGPNMAWTDGKYDDIDDVFPVEQGRVAQ